MTTPEAARCYESQHLMEYAGRGLAIYNPQNKPTNELPIIYGFNNGGSDCFYKAELLAQDGTFLGGHICSSEAYMPADLGVLEGTRPDRHETFRAHYPDGYRMEFVGARDVKRHDGLLAAYALNQEQARRAENE